MVSSESGDLEIGFPDSLLAEYPMFRPLETGVPTCEDRAVLVPLLKANIESNHLQDRHQISCQRVLHSQGSFSSKKTNPLVF